MRLISTSLGSWDTIERGQAKKHSTTFPLAIVHAVIVDAGYPEPECWEGDGPRPEGPWDAVLISAMDPRHFWDVAPWLRGRGIPDLSAERSESDPIVVLGGQAATAPAPVESFVDIVYVGEAEAHLTELMAALDGGGSRAQRLARAAQVPGCYVPSVHPPGHVTQQVYAEDIGITLQSRLWVNHRRIHRVEIARGCLGPASVAPKDPTKNAACGFCALGWRSRYRENDAAAVAASLAETKAMGVNEVHLSAGDAEGHTQIVQMRHAVRELGLRDHSWTGRVDTVRDCSISAGKQFAFGLEGASHRLRAAIGKPRLTDDYIIERVDEYWAAGGRRLMFHFIGGLPSEGPDDYAALDAMLQELAVRASRYGRMHLQSGRQPFGPLPHTPMQYFPPGLVTTKLGEAIARHVGGAHLAVLDKVGQRPAKALLNAITMRGGREVAPLIRQGIPRLPSAGRSLWRTYISLLRRHGLDPARYLGPWDPDLPTPWAHVESAFPLETQRRAYGKMRRVLGYDPASWSMASVARAIAGGS